MKVVKVKYGAIQVKDDDGIIKWAPVMKFGKEDWFLMSHQGRTPLYNTKEEAEAYFKD